ncbi:hypothetical protein ACFVS2_22120 [Brevibacillus sp. NPDC058079]|uniref:hypothetical protein n=1 Tax=Brevibacillus sp. NPDC058079 TaxID=3346330 RepID=UPI0036E79C80
MRNYKTIFIIVGVAIFIAAHVVLLVIGLSHDKDNKDRITSFLSERNESVLVIERRDKDGGSFHGGLLSHLWEPTEHYWVSTKNKMYSLILNKEQIEVKTEWVSS